MNREDLVRALTEARRGLGEPLPPNARAGEAEGGCGVIGMAASVPIAGRHLLRSLAQMRNRGNGKGGGIAAVGLDPEFFGVDSGTLRRDYLLAVALLEKDARARVEREFVEPTFLVDRALTIPAPADFRAIGLEVAPPDVACYLVRVRPDVRSVFASAHGLAGADPSDVDDEIVYQNSYALNKALYASTGEKRAFVLSHGKDLLVLKLVGYGEDVIRAYELERFEAHVWIGHHRYPTKGRVWHPGGAHPFIGMHEALVHNGDFANYASISSYLAQRRLHPLFLTDTEVAALVFDLLNRQYGYPLEHVIEAMAPTTERDFTLLPPEKQRVYRMLQAVHMHSSPDGPWFFLIAQAQHRERAWRLIGITDTSMLRPQVFAVQRGEETIGFAASEKQGIDAALESLASEDARFWPRADLYWNARGGSHTDGGAFVFTVREAGTRRELVCTDKFGHAIAPDPDKLVPSAGLTAVVAVPAAPAPDGDADALFAHAARHLPSWGYGDLRRFLASVEALALDADGTREAIATLTLLIDRRTPTGRLKRSAAVSLVDESLARVVDRIRERSAMAGFAWADATTPLPEAGDRGATLVLDARGFPQEGPDSLARAIVTAAEAGWRRFLVAHTRGHRFIGCGLGPDVAGIRIDVYGSPGDYLGSGIDGAEIAVHASGQDQLAQIMKGGTLVVHGDVGQTFGYAAKGGRAFVLGSAAGRPLINAVGKPRVVINGTCLDYLAESFMAGDPLAGGGFIVLNGVAFDEDGAIADLPSPYPGGNLFSLASGGAIYVRDPYARVTADQLNGGAFSRLGDADWALIEPALEENARLFGIPVDGLLTVDGERLSPMHVYRKIQPAGHEALQPEEAWVRKAG